MKKFAIWMAAMLLVVGVTACGPKPEATDAPADAPAAADAPADAAPAAE